MGFAVIPIIFTIAEDSLANVPQHLRAGSLALGANRWQTAMRDRAADREPGHLLRDHDRLRAGGRRDDDRAHGHRQHAGDGLEHLQRLPRAVAPTSRSSCRRRRRAARCSASCSSRPSCSSASPSWSTPWPSWCACACAGSTATCDRGRKLWRSGEPFIWLTGGALALALIMVAGLIRIILSNAPGVLLAGRGHPLHARGRQDAGRPGGRARAGAGRGRAVPDQGQGGQPRPLRRGLRLGRRGPDRLAASGRPSGGDRADASGGS